MKNIFALIFFVAVLFVWDTTSAQRLASYVKDDSTFIIFEGSGNYYTWMLSYVVKQGETGKIIGEKFFPDQKILQENIFWYNDNIKQGKKLRIGGYKTPLKSYYNYSDEKLVNGVSCEKLYFKVGAKGDNPQVSNYQGTDIDKISSYIGISKTDLKKLNNLNADVLQIGQVLFIGWLKTSGATKNNFVKNNDGSYSTTTTVNQTFSNNDNNKPKNIVEKYFQESKIDINLGSFSDKDIIEKIAILWRLIAESPVDENSRLWNSYSYRGLIEGNCQNGFGIRWGDGLNSLVMGYFTNGEPQVFVEYFRMNYEKVKCAGFGDVRIKCYTNGLCSIENKNSAIGFSLEVIQYFHRLFFASFSKCNDCLRYTDQRSVDKYYDSSYVTEYDDDGFRPLLGSHRTVSKHKVIKLPGLVNDTKSKVFVESYYRMNQRHENGTWRYDFYDNSFVVLPGSLIEWFEFNKSKQYPYTHDAGDFIMYLNQYRQ